MNVLAWIVFGLIVGVIANMLEPNKSNSNIISSIILGIIGSLVGGFLGNILFGVNLDSFSVSSFIIAVGGSLLIIYVAKTITNNSKD